MPASLLQERRNALNHVAWFAIEAGPGDPDHLYHPQLQVLLAQAVTLECSATAMGFVDVEFDGEALRLPIGVELILALLEVHRGGREARPLDRLRKRRSRPERVKAGSSR
jgi:hypothetical protein